MSAQVMFDDSETPVSGIPEGERHRYRKQRYPDEPETPTTVVCPCCRVVITLDEPKYDGMRVFCHPCNNWLVIRKTAEGFRTEVAY
ncbi:MAG: hypothetical protein AB1405_07965 [Bdellovibrionota bacterium]